MNREIKFRAWDGKQMIPHDSLRFFVEFDGTVWENDGTYEYDHLKERSIILMQYTGLKDKNGKEIYDGDFISTDLQRPFNEVVFKNGCFMLRCFDGNEYDDIFFQTSADQQEVYPYGEVIGNIYEHPHLLEQSVTKN